MKTLSEEFKNEFEHERYLIRTIHHDEEGPEEFCFVGHHALQNALNEILPNELNVTDLCILSEQIDLVINEINPVSVKGSVKSLTLNNLKEAVIKKVQS